MFFFLSPKNIVYQLTKASIIKYLNMQEQPDFRLRVSFLVIFEILVHKNKKFRM